VGKKNKKLLNIEDLGKCYKRYFFYFMGYKCCGVMSRCHSPVQCRITCCTCAPVYRCQEQWHLANHECKRWRSENTCKWLKIIRVITKRV